jgi:hypothetical protein
MNSGKQQAADTELAIVQTSVVAWMSDSSPDAGDFAAGSAGPGTSTDFDGGATGNDTIGEYLSSPLAGSYSWDSDGAVTRVSYPGVLEAPTG